MDRLFLGFSIEKLRQSQDRIVQCLDRLSPDQIWWRASEENNSVANLVLHLSGNVRQWIIASVGGKPDVRDRDAEFAARGSIETTELKKRLTDTVDEAMAVLEAVGPERLTETIQVQGYNKTVLEAIYHVVEHFSLHTGQILYATKLMRKEDLGFHRFLAKPAANEKTP